MAKPAKSRTRTKRRSAESKAESSKRYYCSMPLVSEPALPAGIAPERASAILAIANKWVNGTALHYYFFDKSGDREQVLLSNGAKQWRSFVGPEAQRRVVRDAFKRWKALDIGLEFKEVAARDEAEIRVGFMQGDGAWSYVGTDVLNSGPNERTMNFGWSLLRPDGMDTALHEIGHTLGLPHEHQNPNAGIVWDEDAVYDELGKPPNSWPRQTTYHNIIRKIRADTVQGSYWDPNSIMHYPFEPGLILKPAQYASGLNPAGGLSVRDVAWVKSFYPPIRNTGMVSLKPSQSQEIAVKNGEQQNFLIDPPATRDYDIRTFGACDTTMVLFEERNGTWRHFMADDDSGEDRNASLHPKLIKGRHYCLRVRLKYSDKTTMPTIMLW